MRSVIVDTETTGLSWRNGDRIIEIAALECQRNMPTGAIFHCYLDPECAISAGATEVHGILDEDLQGKARFGQMAGDFLQFVGSDPLVAHNAPFDAGFIDMELERAGLPKLGRARWTDTLALARQKFPGSANSLDALCRRFKIDLSTRTKHDALLDCHLLALVNIELMGGMQTGLALFDAVSQEQQYPTYVAPTGRMPRLILPTAAEMAAHSRFIAPMKDAVWHPGWMPEQLAAE